MPTKSGVDNFLCFLNENEGVSLKNYPMLGVFEVFFESKIKLLHCTD